MIQNVDVDTCLNKGCSLGGNIVNQRGDICDVRKCSNLQTLEYTRETGGWNVYAIYPAGTSEQGDSCQLIVILAIVLPCLTIAVTTPISIVCCKNNCVKKNRPSPGTVKSISTHKTEKVADSLKMEKQIEQEVLYEQLNPNTQTNDPEGHYTSIPGDEQVMISHKAE